MRLRFRKTVYNIITGTLPGLNLWQDFQRLFGRIDGLTSRIQPYVSTQRVPNPYNMFHRPVNNHHTPERHRREPIPLEPVEHCIQASRHIYALPRAVKTLCHAISELLNSPTVIRFQLGGSSTGGVWPMRRDVRRPAIPGCSRTAGDT